MPLVPVFANVTQHSEHRVVLQNSNYTYFRKLEFTNKFCLKGITHARVMLKLWAKSWEGKFIMIFYSEDQIVIDVQFHLRVDDSQVTASDQAWMSFLLNTHTIFSFFLIIIITKLGILRSVKIKSVQVDIQVVDHPGKMKSLL